MRKPVLFLCLLLLTASARAQNVAEMNNGVRATTGTSYTVVAADALKLVTLNNASPVAVTLPSPATAGFGAGYVFKFKNIGAGVVTITSSSSQIDGAASITLSQGQSTKIYSDGSNYTSTPMPVGANSTANAHALPVYSAASGSVAVQPDTGAYSDGAGNLNVASVTTSGSGPDTFSAIADGTTANSFWLSSTTANRFKTYVGGALQQFAYASDLGTAASKNVLGTGTSVPTTSASAPAGNRCVEMDTSANLVLAAAACGSGGGVSTTGSPVSGQVAVMSGANSITGYAGMTADASGNLSAASVTTTATGAGSLQLTQGTAPAPGTTAVTLAAPSSVTSYVAELPGAAPTAGNTFLSCTAAAPSICSWAAGGGGGATISGTPSLYQAAVWASASAVAGVGPGTAKQVYVSGGPSANPTYIDFPDVHYIPSANCNNASAATAWNLPATNPPTVACRTGTNVQAGVLQFTATTHTAQFQIGIPADWDSSVNPSARIFLIQGNANTGQTITMTLATGCGATDDQAFNTAQGFSNITTNATAYTETEATLTNITMTGCTAGGLLDVKIGVSSLGTNQAWVQMVAVTFPRLLTVGAM